MQTVKTPSSTLNQWRAYMIAAGLSKRTITERTRTLSRIEADLRCPALSADHFQLAEWISQGDVSPGSRVRQPQPSVDMELVDPFD